MNKDKFEEMCRNAGLQPELRGEVGGLDFFIADGFSTKPESDFRKFGGTREEFPHGAFGTLWLVAKGEDRVIGGGMCLFDTFHDIAHRKDVKKNMRINCARKAAQDFLDNLSRVRADA